MPRLEMKESRDNTWVTPARSILNRFRFQFPVAKALMSPFVITLALNFPSTSKDAARLGFCSTKSASRLMWELKRLNKSSNINDSN